MSKRAGRYLYRTNSAGGFILVLFAVIAFYAIAALGFLGFLYVATKVVEAAWS